MSNLPPPPEGMEWVWTGEGEPPGAPPARAVIDQTEAAAPDQLVSQPRNSEANGSSSDAQWSAFSPSAPASLVTAENGTTGTPVEGAMAVPESDPVASAPEGGRTGRSPWVVNGLTLVIDVAIILLLLELAHFL